MIIDSSGDDSQKIDEEDYEDDDASEESQDGGGRRSSSDKMDGLDDDLRTGSYSSPSKGFEPEVDDVDSVGSKKESPVD